MWTRPLIDVSYVLEKIELIVGVSGSVLLLRSLAKR